MADALPYSADLLERARAIKVVFFDVDGVLTDGGLLYSETGETLKRFHTLDGHGLKMLQKAGITPAVITGRDSAPLRKRLQALGITHAHFDTEDKAPAALITMANLGVDWIEVASMGDDWPDLPMMLRSALACAPANAHPEVLARAHFVTHRHGGHGAVRELCDLLLSASSHYQTMLLEYTQ